MPDPFEVEPTSRLSWQTYWLTIPGFERECRVFVDVDTHGMIGLNERLTAWFGAEKKDGLLDHGTRREIYDWLIEWDLATWKKIGPEDTELFVTEKLG